MKVFERLRNDRVSRVLLILAGLLLGISCAILHQEHIDISFGERRYFVTRNATPMLYWEFVASFALSSLCVFTSALYRLFKE